MTDKVRVALCKHKKENHSLTHKELMKWLEREHEVKSIQATVSPDVEDIIEDHLQADTFEAEDDDSQEVPLVSAAEAYKMIQSLETF
jgi:hypothetical protein